MLLKQIVEIVALNSTSQFIKDDFFYMPSSYSSLCCTPDLVKEKYKSVYSLKVHDSSVFELNTDEIDT